MSLLLPFEAALGPGVAQASPRVREHFLQPPGTRRYRGRMTRVWRARGWRGLVSAPVLWLGSRAHLLFSETGEDVAFELENVVTAHPDGRARMTWTRTFRFPRATHVFHAVMVHDPERGLIDDRLGRRGLLEVELAPRVEHGGVVVDSRRQWLRLGRLRVPLPAWLAGHARIHEWEDAQGRLAIRVTVSNPLLGAFFGYEGSFERVE